MSLSVGIVGLPNVGKSTLFNALLKKQLAYVANYPFATIEPNVGVVPVPDERLEKLAEVIVSEKEGPAVRSSHGAPASLVRLRRTANADALRGSPTLASPFFPPIVPATVQFVDIAGLVKGANEGAGLGNKFLSHIREVSIIAHVVRAFNDENVVKEGSVDPMSDYQTVQTELILADLQSIENAKGKAKPFGFAQGESLKQQSKAQNGLEKVREALNRGISARDIKLTDEEREAVRDMFLLSLKPEIVVFNVLEEDYGKDGEEKMLVQWSSRLDCGKENIMVICAKIESELSELSEKDQKEYLQNLGLQESGLEKLIKEAYKALDLISFLTAGAKEVRAWTIKRGTKALDAAGVIHTDFTTHFIKAEVVSFDDFVNLGGWKKAREAGKTRFEGRDYIMQDGDVVEFKIGN